MSVLQPHLLGQGFLLGLSSGVTCAASCALVLLPVIIGTAGGLPRTGLLTLRFLVGRLAGYLAVGLGAWAVGRQILSSPEIGRVITPCLSFATGVLMLLFGLRRLRSHEAAAPVPQGSCLVSPWSLRQRLSQWPSSIPYLLGFLSATSLCPPLVSVVLQGATLDSVPKALLFFCSFFLGTSLFFIPVPLLSFFRGTACRTISGFAAILVGAGYLYATLLEGLSLFAFP